MVTDDDQVGAIIASLAGLVGLPLPSATPIAAANLPEPERTLLANAHDMTPTLERFHGSVLHLQVLSVQRDGDLYRRQVLLLDPRDRPVEFGAIRIHLAALPPAARAEVLAGRRPLGGILHAHAVPHHSSPRAYFSLAAISGGPGAAVGGDTEDWGLGAGAAAFSGADGRLYGRCYVLSAPDGQPIAEVVEILPHRGRETANDGVGGPSVPPLHRTQSTIGSPMATTTPHATTGPSAAGAGPNAAGAGPYAAGAGPSAAGAGTSANGGPEVLIIGGGPAGSTAATVLAMHGRKVVVLDKAAFPRYHIGESLIPYTWFTLNRIGLVDKLKASHFTKKYSICFVSQNGKQSQPFFFDSHFDHPATQTWQVLRSEFDALLRDNAKEKGAEFRHGFSVETLVQENGRTVGVAGRDETGRAVELRAQITIDASGRDAVAVNQFGWRVPDKPLDRFAIWSYWKGAKRDPGRAGGATTVAYLPDRGWFWYIPLHDDVLSVGVVAKKEYLFRDTQDLAAIYHRETQANAWLKDCLAPATQCAEVRITNEYSYRSRHCAADGLVLAGDAFNFLDPVFSSGAFFALRSGELAADAVHAALGRGDTSAAAFTEYGQRYCAGIEAMRKLVYAFYDENVNFGHFIRQHPDLKADLTDCIIGHVEKDFRPLFTALGGFAQLPEDLPFGGPLG